MTFFFYRDELDIKTCGGQDGACDGPCSGMCILAIVPDGLAKFQQLCPCLVAAYLGSLGRP